MPTPSQTPGSVVPQMPAPPIGPSPSATLDKLLSHADELESALAGLNAQKQTLQSQLHSQPREVRAAIAPQLGQLDLQIAQVSGALASTRNQIARQSGPATTGQPPMPPLRGRGPSLNGDDVTGIVIVFILAVLMPLSIGMLRRLWRVAPRDRSVSLPDVISPRLDRLEQAVDAIALEVERISEGQRFVTKVLVERPIPAPMPISIPAHGSEGPASLGEAKPFRALGAGPVEPIRIQERQVVRPSITPH